jgi:hypothetical protein
MTTVEILRAARGRMDTPERWYGGPSNPFPGGDAVGRECALVAIRHAGEAAACDWVAVGGAFSRSNGLGDHAACIPAFNNSHEHAEVLAAFDRAIADAEAVEQEHAPVRLDAAIPERLPEVAA